MDDSISRKALLEKIMNEPSEHYPDIYMDIIENAPTVKVSPKSDVDRAYKDGYDTGYQHGGGKTAQVRHGHWIRIVEGDEEYWKCSDCKQERWLGYGGSDGYNYCPRCGARMDDDESDGRTSERTLDNCRMIKRHGRPEQNRAAVTCLGFGRAEYDDEPCDTCKQCPLQESNAYERDERLESAVLRNSEKKATDALRWSVDKYIANLTREQAREFLSRLSMYDENGQLKTEL